MGFNLAFKGLKCGLSVYRNNRSYNVTINVSDDGLLRENMPVILDVFHCRGFFCTSVVSGTVFISVITYKCSYPVDHLLIPALSEGSKLVADFMHDSGNRDSITLRLEEAKMATDVYKVNCINYKFFGKKITSENMWILQG